MMFVRCLNTPTAHFAALQKMFARLKAYKEASATNPVSLEQTDFWELSPPAQRHFYIWDKEQLTHKQAKVSLPEPRFDDEKWHVGALLTSLKESDYKLDEIVEYNEDIAELRIKEAGARYAGVDDLMELIEAFGLELTAYNDAGRTVDLISG